ncbi:MAG: ParA family protein [Pseudomonadota bacterium]
MAGKIITFAQQKGGAGKSTVAAQLAVAFAAKYRVAVLDLDPQGSLSRWASVRDDPALPCQASKDWRAGSDLRDAARSHDLVIADCPGNAEVLLRAALRESDLVLLPAQPTSVDLWASAPVLAMAAEEKTPAAVILNRVPPRGTELPEEFPPAPAQLLAARLGNRIAFSRAFAQGRTAMEVEPRSKAAEEVRALAAEVAGLLDL